MIVIFDIDDTLLPTLHTAFSLGFNVNLKAEALYKVMDDETYKQYSEQIHDIRKKALDLYSDSVYNWFEYLNTMNKAYGIQETYVTSNFEPEDSLFTLLQDNLNIKDFVKPSDLLRFLHKSLVAYDDNPERIGKYLAMGNAFINVVAYPWNSCIQCASNHINLIYPTWSNMIVMR